MAQYKLKKGQKLGALSAETDKLLNRVYVDTGYLEKLIDVESPYFLVVGRTGSGKTALIKAIEWNTDKYSILDPDELSMQYLHSNHIIKFIKSLGVHLDIFLKFLWRHIFVLELIKMRYEENENKQNLKMKILTWLFSNPNKDTENEALEYLEKHGDEYWITADTHIKAFTQELSSKISDDKKVGLKTNAGYLSLGGEIGITKEQKNKKSVDKEIKERVQEIVNGYQISALNEILKKMIAHSFNDPKKKYYLIIDDLDKNWMPDDELYLELLKSLLYTVKEINQKFDSVKLIVALRTNIYYRIFRKSLISEPQREKWNDVIIEMLWSKNDIINIVDKRLSELYREQYTKSPPTIAKILPTSKRKTKDNPLDYIIERTFNRPRDILSFMNHCFNQSDEHLNLTWKIIRNAESEYSRERLNSIIDEWKDSYYGLPSMFDIIRNLGVTFVKNDISDSDINKVFNYKHLNECRWLTRLQEEYCNNNLTFDDIRNEILSALYNVGIIGIKNISDHKVYYSFQKPLDSIMDNKEFNEKTIFCVHKTFWKSLGLKLKD